ncbi:hypothetical protein IscW_ISCW020344 [Ixodes scapularis]|uniref:Uncharacterized protein n=1 Tax=Ixodes scapularis TaxID=6945 RepID=B7PY07_IXOSC|nr:hypothetical protein IscW_ISCW020344 [Ixodes scapularis]|eukprot:XP_002402295.1 hypothetical protein IscW_ISCW020344 [Ixodes scapularis]
MASVPAQILILPGRGEGERHRPPAPRCPGGVRGGSRLRVCPPRPPFPLCEHFEDLRDDDCGDDLHPPWRKVCRGGRPGRLDEGRGGAGNGAVPLHFQNGSKQVETRRGVGQPTP